MSVAIEFDVLDLASAPDPFAPSDLPALPARPARLREVGRAEPAVPFCAPFNAPSSAPGRRRAARGLSAVGVVTVLRPPAPVSAPVRLTRRGVVVLALAVAALGLALVWAAALSAPSSAAAPAGGPSVVTVHPGDTLWSIASRVAPQRSPAAEVATLQQLNHLGSAELVPGQRLHVR
jgi:Tfp pilus assembly protein FimV